MSRLVDADALIEKLKRTSAFEYVRNSEDKNVFEIIAEEPTAYDPEKVVAELEKEKEIHTNHYNISIYKDFPDVKQRYKQIQRVLDKAIGTVKRGGVE